MNPAIPRARELWARLQAFFNANKWYRASFEKWMSGQISPDRRPSPEEVQNQHARYLLYAPLAGGATVLERFIDGLPRKAAEDRAIAVRWREASDGVLELQEATEGGYRCFDLVFCRKRILASEDLRGLPADPRGGFLAAFFLPIDGECCFLGGVARFLPRAPESRVSAMDAARDYRLQYAQRILAESPAQREESMRIRRVFAIRFAARFGGPEWVTTGLAYVAAMRQFFAALEEEGRTGDRSSVDHVAWHELELERQFPCDLPAHLVRSENLGVVCDEQEEPLILGEYGRFQGALAADDPETVPGWRKRLRAYLMDPTVSELPFRLALARNPERVLDRMRQAMELSELTREAFDTMLRQAKAPHLPSHLKPTWVPTPDWSGMLPAPE